MTEAMPSKANSYYVIGRCRCGELLTVELGSDIRAVHQTSDKLRHVSTYRRECPAPMAEIEEYR